MTNSTKPLFRETDRKNLELVRQIVLFRLKNDPEWSQFDYTWDPRYVSRFVDFENPYLRDRFVFLANEIMWQLLIQGVISVGLNAHNLNLPFFHITDYGHDVLNQERFIPHDPTGYLIEIKSLSGSILSVTAITYIEEALHCFNAGCHIAAVLLLGVAAESVFLNLCAVIQTTLIDGTGKKNLDSKVQVKTKHRWIIQKYQGLDGKIRGELPESLDTTLISLYELIRRQRNELGHPQENPPELTREQAFVFFKLFPSFVKDLEAFAVYCQTHGL